MLFNLLTLTGIALTLLPVPAHALVFDTDKRLDLNEVESPSMQRLAKSVFTFIPRDNLIRLAGGNFEFSSREPLKESVNLCPGERFENQLSAKTRCSGFLVAPEFGITAGHCISHLTVKDFCKNYFIVFDYRMVSEGTVPAVLDASSVRECSGIVKEVFDPSNESDDYAVLRFSEPVADRSPLKYRKAGQIVRDAPIFMLGYPRGLPEKISPGRKVIGDGTASYFSTNLDCFHGNSGSPVFNANTLEVEGIFVRGEGEVPNNSSDPALVGDFLYDSIGKCNKTLVCRRIDGCTAVMDATRITRVTW